MAFRDNSKLVTGASEYDIGGEGIPGTWFAGIDARTFMVAETEVYRQQIVQFGSDDTITTSRPIFDGNADGFIELNDDHYIRVNLGYVEDETVERDIVQFFGENHEITSLRALGEKGGAYVYADSQTLTNLTDRFGAAAVVEGDVGNDMLDMGSGARVLLHDNALGLNLGGDRISNFGGDDLLATTRALYDGNGDGIIRFGRNGVLDASGSGGPKATDPTQGPGGQLDFRPSGITALELVRTEEIGGVTYYFYAIEGAAPPLT